MTVQIESFTETEKSPPITLAEMGRTAGRLLYICSVFDNEFVGTHGDWRIIIRKVSKIRQMVREDFE